MWIGVHGRDVRVPCSLVTPTLYPQLLPLSHQAQKYLEGRSRMVGLREQERHCPLSPSLGFLDLVCTPDQRLCPQWNFDLKVFPASHIAEDRMNRSVSREELSLRVLPAFFMLSPRPSQGRWEWAMEEQRQKFKSKGDVLE